MSLPGTAPSVALIAGRGPIAAPTLDGFGIQQVNNQGLFTVSSVTPSGPHNFVAVSMETYLSGSGASVTSCTWNGVSMTNFAGIVEDGSRPSLAFFYLYGATTGDIVAAYSDSGADAHAIIAFSIGSSMQSGTPIDTVVAQSNTTSALASPGAGGIRLCAVASNDALSPSPSGCTELKQVSVNSASADLSLFVGYSLGDSTSAFGATTGEQIAAGAFR